MSDTQYGSKPIHRPEGNIYFIGDVHNEADKLMDVLDQIEPLLTEHDHVVFLGDLFDRGLMAALTVETLVDFTRRHPSQVFFVRGNHCFMLQQYLATGSQGWFTYLLITLQDFKRNWNLPDIMPDTIAKALEDKGFREITSRMLPYYESEETIGTHAPFDRSSVAVHGGMHYQEDYKGRASDPAFRYLLDRMEYELLWQFTDEKLEIPWVDKFRVCGHQPGHHKNPRLFKDRAFIDTGCGKGNRPLTCLVYPSKKTYQSFS
jgi:hypothetical protein